MTLNDKWEEETKSKQAAIEEALALARVGILKAKNIAKEAGIELGGYAFSANRIVQLLDLGDIIETQHPGWDSSGCY